MFSGLKSAIPLFVTVVLAGCHSPAEGPRATIQPEYDSKTGRLKRLHYDSNGNGRTDTWSLMDGARVIRVDIDKDEDGRIDRWEHYGPGNTLIIVGFSRLNDGVEDAWTYANPDGTVARIQISTRRNGQINRTEFYDRNVLVRAEEDSNLDGKLDKWETFEDGRLAIVAVDTIGQGTPNRRVIHSADGTSRVEGLPAK